MAMFRCGSGKKAVLKRVLLGTNGSSYDVSKYKGYEKFTTNNFFAVVEPVTMSGNGCSIGYSANGDKGYFTSKYAQPSLTYDASTGLVKVSNGRSYEISLNRGETGKGYGIAGTTVNFNVKTYLVYVE